MFDTPRRSIFLMLGCVSIALQLSSQSWEEGDGFSSLSASAVSGDSQGFSLIESGRTGLDFTNSLVSDRGLRNQILLNGSGVAAGDVNGDGLCDLYFCGLDRPNMLFINHGNWMFEESVIADAILCKDQSSTGAVFADVNGDGSLDLLVTGHQKGVRLFLNEGEGSFIEVTKEWGLASTSGSASMTLADVDGNGWLDLYVVNYRNDTMRDLPNGQFDVRLVNGEYRLLSYNGKSADSPDLKGRFTFNRSQGVLENGEPDQLFLNSGRGQFEPVNWQEGHFLDTNENPVETPYDWGLSAMFYDFNGDLAPDLYVCNDFQSPDRIWINMGDGRFKAMDDNRIRQTSLFSMGLDFSDINRDGLSDLFVVDMLSRSHLRRMVQVMDGMAFAQYRDTLQARPQSPRNTLFIQRNNQTFSETARYSGVEASDWSWCPVFLDVDLDGYEDLLITTGHWRDAQNADVSRDLDAMIQAGNYTHAQKLAMRSRFPVLNTPNIVFKNMGNAQFEDNSAAWGFNSTQVSHGMVQADLDNDGDLDIAINCLNAQALLYRNDSSNPRVRVQLKGSRQNTAGIGGLIKVNAPGLPLQTQSIISGGRYLSGDQAVRSFAVQNESDTVTVEINWRNGRHDLYENMSANRLYVFHENKKANPHITTKAPAPQMKTLFEDVSQRLNHRHSDQPYDDFMRQPMLPRKLSSLGPGLAWFDFNQDGWEDLFIGGGKKGKLGVFRNEEGLRFVRQRAKAFEAELPRDQTSIIAWRPDSTDMALLLGQSAYESFQKELPVFNHFSMVTGKMETITNGEGSSTGPMTMADWDGDGDLDLFVGGRVQSGRFPENPQSLLYRNHNGKFVPALESSQPFKNVGMVSAAIFSDLTGDPLPDLMLACDWGPLYLFENKGGQFVEVNKEVYWSDSLTSKISFNSLNSLRGWWTSLTAMDANQDGRLDLVAGNWGRNHERGDSSFQPLRIYYGVASGPGGYPSVESHWDQERAAFVPSRDWGTLSASLPWLNRAFKTFQTFAHASIDEALQTIPGEFKFLEARCFESIVFLNLDSAWKAIPLPDEAQMTPLFGIGIGDFNNDGMEDLVGSQNFFGVNTLDSRQDAGTGLLLFGNGDGTFTASMPASSGIAIRGEGRGLAVADFDHDGRADFIATQHSGPTKLYRNLEQKVGLAVRLKGPDGNLQAIGAKGRLIYENGTKGPTREWRLGDGYWSQTPNRQVFGFDASPAALEVRWPTGDIQVMKIQKGQKEIRITVSP